MCRRLSKKSSIDYAFMSCFQIHLEYCWQRPLWRSLDCPSGPQAAIWMATYGQGSWRLWSSWQSTICIAVKKIWSRCPPNITKRQYMAKCKGDFDVVSYPTRWSLLFIFRFLYGSSKQQRNEVQLFTTIMGNNHHWGLKGTDKTSSGRAQPCDNCRDMSQPWNMWSSKTRLKKMGGNHKLWGDRPIPWWRWSMHYRLRWPFGDSEM